MELFCSLAEDVPGVLLESVDTAPIYGRQSIVVIDPPLEVFGDANGFTLRSLNSFGRKFLRHFNAADFPYCQKLQLTADVISGQVPAQSLSANATEAQRYTLSNSTLCLRTIMRVLATPDPLLGLYGMFSYDCVRLFEQLPTLQPPTVPDFHFVIPDLIYHFDHHRQTASLRYYHDQTTPLAERLASLPRRRQPVLPFSVRRVQANLTQTDYEDMVKRSKIFMQQGDIFEIVLSRQLQGQCNGSSLDLYRRYREVNPSPYMFYCRLPEADGSKLRVLLGASPEMFVRVANDRVITRPISGTAPRSRDAITDYQLMLDLLNNSKEKSELDMLIDLGRNDLARVCNAGIQLSDYRYVEKYARVMHTVAQVEGDLDVDHYQALDALLACLPAGTLTGAPKIRAMQLIDELEGKRRGLYGGCVGYLTFNNELNTGIIIRSAVINGDQFTMQVGASIVYESNPVAEFKETEHKAAALLQTVTALWNILS